MTIVNLYGTHEEIDMLRAAANGVKLDDSFNNITTENPTRINSNADYTKTVARLSKAGAKTVTDTFKRGDNYVNELTARF